MKFAVPSSGYLNVCPGAAVSVPPSDATYFFVGKFSSLRRHKDTYFITIAPNVFGSFGLQAVNAGIESNAVTVQPFTIVIIVSTSRKNKG